MKKVSLMSMIRPDKEVDEYLGKVVVLWWNLYSNGRIKRHPLSVLSRQVTDVVLFRVARFETVRGLRIAIGKDFEKI